MSVSESEGAPPNRRGTRLDLTALAHRLPYRLPTVALSPARQLTIFAIVFAVVLPLPILCTGPTIFSDHANPILTPVGALVIALLTFTGMHMWSLPVAVTHVALTATWILWHDPLGPVSALLIAGLITGVALAVASSRCFTDDHMFAISFGGILIGAIGLFTLAGLVNGFDPIVRMDAISRHVVESTLRTFRNTQFQYGPLRYHDSVVVGSLWMAVPDWVRLMPARGASAIAFGLFITLRHVRRRLHGAAERMFPFWMFRVHEIYVFPVIGLCLLEALAITRDIMPLQAVCENLLHLLLNLYWLSGLAVCHCAMLQLRMGIFFRVWLWVLLLIVWPYPMAALGLFDTWFNFRKLTGRLGQRRIKS